jgi:hypothetical protein
MRCGQWVKKVAHPCSRPWLLALQYTGFDYNNLTKK